MARPKGSKNKKETPVALEPTADTPLTDTPLTADIPPEEKPQEIVVPAESGEKKAFRDFMEKYKVQNPVKYALKEAEFLKKLNSL
jgi:hypothetical protein